MAKPKVTRTYGPIHFEDLDPHRFEDLIRELIYDYKDWQSIEATGRSGSDEGFDIRAYEKKYITNETENANGSEVEEIHPMEGNLWMIQGKREKEIGPKRVETIVKEINEKNPPYGYILVAPANFSKKSYDVFREKLRKKGVMEFYLWGKAELEDTLLLPKNDHILFTFFGISLASRRRSRTTEVRSAISIKNKLYRTLGEQPQLHNPILIRDLKDTFYPYENKYKDFKEKPRWKEYTAIQYYPLGLLCNVHKYFAYIDEMKKEWDFTEEIDLTHKHSNPYQFESGSELKIKEKKRDLVTNTWEFFPRINQGYFIINCLIKYSDISLIDDKGDFLYKIPHLYVDFVRGKGPFAGCIELLKIDGREIKLPDGFKRIKVFPKEFRNAKPGKIHEKMQIIFDSNTLEKFKKYAQVDTIYDSEGKYSFLNPRDIISVANKDEKTEKVFIQITHKFKSKIKDYLELVQNAYEIGQNIKNQLGRDYNNNEEINIYEFKRIGRCELENRE